MKVLFYSALSLRFGGGFERWMLEVVSHLKKRGVSSIIVCTKSIIEDVERISNQQIQETLNKASAEYFELPYHSLHIAASNSPIPRVTELNRHVRDCDIVYFSNAYAFQDLMICLLKLIQRKPVISGQHSTLFSDSRPHNIYINTLGKKLLNHFDVCHVLNSNDLHFFKKWGLKRVCLIPPGINTQIFKPMDHVRRHIKFKVLFVGRLTSQKGIDVLCRSIEIFNKTNDEFSRNVDFVIVGSGPLESLVQKLNKRYTNVKYLGAVPQKTLHEIYGSCDLFLMPSRRETFGNVALEAQAYGLPVIASDIPGPSDIIIDGVTGTLLREKSVKALISAINMYYRLWFQDYEKYREIFMNARQNAMKYDWRNVSKRLYDMLVNVYRDRGSSD